MKKAIRPFRRLSDAINKLPFGGVFLVRPVLLKTYTAKSGDEKTFYALLTLSIFTGLSCIHYLQAMMGWEIFTQSSLYVVQGFGFVYVVVNALVIYTQIFLALRLLGHIKRIVIGQTKLGRREYHFKQFSGKYIILSLVFTYGGQAIFIFTYKYFL